ncbi:hypothetical protein WJX75_006922 [Coccomyxa subellipsoidea]|uniref:Uncharacterized protein n=1 Tax=Coccomyxa subellipsoidea TaxID=248742 RepID=A0ABR2Z118_9CHLO
MEQGDEVCLKYLLDLPDEPGPVQDDFPISLWGHNAIAVKNLRDTAEHGISGTGAAKIPLRDVSLLDSKGCELELVSTALPDPGVLSAEENVL